jgi:hypothetical protein
MNKYLCTYCGCEFYRYKSTVSKTGMVFCCKEHYYKYLKESDMFRGDKNPNYGNRWSPELRKKFSNYRLSLVTDEFRKQSGSYRKGYKYSEEEKEKYFRHKNHNRHRKPHTEESKKIIGIKSKEKFSKHGYKENIRKIMVEKGYWIDKNLKNDYDIYVELSNWIENMFDRCKDEEKVLLEKRGIFNSTNTKGVVRDHKYSRISGYTNCVFPEILRHPCNCEIILHAENISKRFSNGNSLELEQLFDLILSYSGIWKEQSLVIKMIEMYKNGERWKNPFGGNNGDSWRKI